MRLRNRYIFQGSIDASHFSTQPREGLGQQSGATAEIKHAFARQRDPCFGVAMPVRIDCIANITKPHGVKPVQHPR